MASTSNTINVLDFICDSLNALNLDYDLEDMNTLLDLQLTKNTAKKYCNVLIKIHSDIDSMNLSERNKESIRQIINTIVINICTAKCRAEVIGDLVTREKSIRKILFTDQP